MANIPPDIWRYIAKFIPDKTLRDLLTVNSTFFNIAMDLRYRKIVIDTRAINQSMKTLKRLSDPFIAYRLHQFSLRLIHNEFWDTRANESGFRILHQLQRAIRAITRVFRGPKLPWSQPVRVTVSLQVTDLINEIINTTKKLVNVRKLLIDYLDTPLGPPYDPQSFLSSLLSSVGQKLHTLSLSGNLESYCTLLQPNPNLDELQELRLDFFRVSVDVILPFVNSLAPRLVSLMLSSRSSNLPAFFSSLAPFPVLEALTIHIFFDGAPGDASCLRSLISNSADTLQRVTLHLHSSLRMDRLLEARLSRWLLECISEERFFFQLRVLDIYPTDLAVGMEFLLGCIRRASHSLVELVVVRHLQESEVEAVLDGASSCNNLTCLELDIEVRRLDVALIDCLALKLPQINRLWLRIAENAVHYFDDSTLVQDLGTRSYTNWKLKEIAIWRNGQTEVDSDTMLAIARSIPSYYGSASINSTT